METMISFRRPLWIYHSPRVLGFLSAFDPTGRLLRGNPLLPEDPSKFPEFQKILTVRPQVMTVATWINATMTRARRAPAARYAETKRPLPPDDAPRPQSSTDAKVKMFRNRGPRVGYDLGRRDHEDDGDSTTRAQASDQEGT
jgi:hypothetical protein